MAVNINNTYRTVQAILNIEQRGYLAPGEFNRYAAQVQLEIFESYPFDLAHFGVSRKGMVYDTGHSDIKKNIREKIDVFSVLGDMTYNPVTSQYDVPTNFYRLDTVQVTKIGTGNTVNAEEVDKKDIVYIENSPLTAPTAAYPKYVRLGDNVEILPRPASISQTFTPSTATNTFVLTGVPQSGSTASTTPAGMTAITAVTTDANEVVLAGITMTLSGNTITTSRNITDTETIVITYTGVATIDGVRIHYIKQPADPIWGYNNLGVSRTPIYNSDRSTDFELHPSEQYKLVEKILAYAGVQIKEAEVVQFALNDSQLDEALKKQ